MCICWLFWSTIFFQFIIILFLWLHSPFTIHPPPSSLLSPSFFCGGFWWLLVSVSSLYMCFWAQKWAHNTDINIQTSASPSPFPPLLVTRTPSCPSPPPSTFPIHYHLILVQLMYPYIVIYYSDEHKNWVKKANIWGLRTFRWFPLGLSRRDAASLVLTGAGIRSSGGIFQKESPKAARLRGAESPQLNFALVTALQLRWQNKIFVWHVTVTHGWQIDWNCTVHQVVPR